MFDAFQFAGSRCRWREKESFGNLPLSEGVLVEDSAETDGIEKSHASHARGRPADIIDNIYIYMYIYIHMYGLIYISLLSYCLSLSLYIYMCVYVCILDTPHRSTVPSFKGRSLDGPHCILHGYLYLKKYC